MALDASTFTAPKHHGDIDCPWCRGFGSFEMEGPFGKMVTHVCGSCNAPVDHEAEHLAKFHRDQDLLYALIEARQLEEDAEQ